MEPSSRAGRFPSEVATCAAKEIVPMKKIGLAIAATAAGLSLAVSAASAAPAAVPMNDSGAGLVHKVGGVYIDIGPPRYYGYGGYYDRPYYPSYGYGYYAPRYYSYGGYGYGRYGHGRRWVKERFEHPLGRR
jgi:hypothetical protein